MIHWRETDTGYVATVSRLKAAGFWCPFGLAIALVGVGAGSGWRSIFGFNPFPGPASLAWIGPAIAAACLVKALVSLRSRGWVEVSLQGGRARWGRVDDCLSERFVDVAGFQSVEALGPWAHHVIVVLPDGRRVPVLRGNWSTPAAVARVVTRLNELVGVDRAPT